MAIAETPKDDEGIEIICKNKNCKFTWRYKGKRMYATCPNCRRLNKVSK